MNTVAMIIGYGTIGIVILAGIAFVLLYGYAKHMGMPD